MIYSQSAKEVLSDQVISGTSMVGITELACAVNASARSYFNFHVLFQQSLLTDSIRMDLSYPSNPVSIVYTVSVPGVASTSNSPGIGTSLAAANTNYLAKIEGSLVNGQNEGILQPQVASTGALSSITIKANSYVMSTTM